MLTIINTTHVLMLDAFLHFLEYKTRSGVCQCARSWDSALIEGMLANSPGCPASPLRISLRAVSSDVLKHVSSYCTVLQTLFARLRAA